MLKFDDADGHDRLGAVEPAAAALHVHDDGLAGVASPAAVNRHSGAGILVRSLGGLGNQIFVYAFAQWLRRELRARPIFFDLGSDPIAGRSTRAVQLQQLFGGLGMVRGVPAYLINFLSLSRKYQRSLGKIALAHFQPASMAECMAAVARLRAFAFPRWPVFTGYFQYAALVRAELGDLRGSAGAELRRRRQALQRQGLLGDFEFERDCVLHVRRGDYKGIRGFNLLPGSYYRNAATVLRRQGAGRLFFVSDDPGEARRLLESAGLTVSALALEDPLDVLTVIGHARQRVIANSTLSLWGALLGRTDAAVVFPTDWPPGAEENSEICRERGWTACPG